MIKAGISFSFTAPAGWKEFKDGNRLVFQGANREELIVSGSLIRNTGTIDDPEIARKALFSNAEQSIRRAAAHPALKITKQLQRDSLITGLECWTINAETHEGDVLFCQAVLQSNRGVMLVTFEAPNTTASKDHFSSFLKSIFPTTAED